MAISILTGALAAWLAYRILFYDSDDFWDGFGRFTAGLLRRRSRWIWQQRNDPPPPPEYFEDESWSSGLRFFVFVAVSFGSAWLVYYQLRKRFG